MKPLPAPNVAGDTPWERLDNAVRAVFRVPKEALLKEEARRIETANAKGSGLRRSPLPKPCQIGSDPFGDGVGKYIIALASENQSS